MSQAEKTIACLKTFRDRFRFEGLQRYHFTKATFGNTTAYLIYRLIITAYWIGVWIYRVVTFPTLNEIYTDFLTNWTDTCICCYFISTTAILLYYAWKGSSANGNAPAVCYILQILYEICLTASILVVASVWISAGINSNLENDYGTSTWSFNPSNMPLLIQNLHGHIFVMVFMFIDFAVNMIPMNIVHLLYLWMFGWIYALATFIVYTIDESRDEVYPILNWKYGKFRLDGEWFPIGTVGIYAIFIFIISTLFHILLTVLSHYKVFYFIPKVFTEPSSSRKVNPVI